MEANQVINLYDSFWFEMEIVKVDQPQLQSSISGHNPSGQFQEESSKPEKDEKILIRVPTIITRSMSEQLSFKFLSSSSAPFPFSPDSVLSTPRQLKTILSGKEVPEEGADETYVQSHIRVERGNRSSGKRGKKGNRSRSLSELEIEELKGFTDLGFVFSEEDRDSSLVSIIPGLQRLGRNNNNNNNNDNKIIGDEDVKKKNSEDSGINEPAISRPYLSEAWEDLDRKRRENPLANWGIPTLSNEIEIKDSLRWWAHTVASHVR